jgi:hypothetical protein
LEKTLGDLKKNSFLGMLGEEVYLIFSFHGIRLLQQLRLVFQEHPHLDELAQFVTNGMDYRFLRELSDADRLSELNGMIHRGNHKSSESEQVATTQLLHKDVTHGFSMPIHPSIAPSLKDAIVQPLGMAKQFTLLANMI